MRTMVSCDQIIDRVRAVVAENQRIPVEQVTADTTFEELGMDSLDATNLLFSLEEAFDISIPDDDAKALQSVRQVAGGIQKLLAEAPSDTTVSAG
jgi:acyl carrier protein